MTTAQMILSRRKLLKGGCAALALLGLPRLLLAGAWPKAAFAATEATEARIKLLGTDQPTPSDEIQLSAPMVAEDGSIVPISVETKLQDVRSISIVVMNNPRPLAVSFEIHAGTLPEVSCRIKMAETSDVMALVRTGKGIFSTSTHVKVTLGGCA
jgi:sulfur-oxidizing protein SoxY